MIDLGPADGGATQKTIATALGAAGLVAVSGDDGVEVALAGEGGEIDAAGLAAAMATAKAAMGSLDCAGATAAAKTAIALGAARQAAGLAVPELAGAWGLVLACADRAGASDAAMYAAREVRVVGGGPADVLAKYPSVDVMGGAEQIDVDVATDASVAGAAVWIDHARVPGVAPVHVRLEGGWHVIAVAAGAGGARRGAIEIDLTRDVKTIAVPVAKQRGKWSDVAMRVAGWHGMVPAPDELAKVLTAVSARVAVLRYGGTVEAWGAAGAGALPKRIGGEDGVGTVADAPKIAGAIVDRVRAWDGHAPDPDRPLLVERRDRADDAPHEHAKWWVYAAGLGALAAIAGGVYWHDQQHDTQHIELRYP